MCFFALVLLLELPLPSWTNKIQTFPLHMPYLPPGVMKLPIRRIRSSSRLILATLVTAVCFVTLHYIYVGLEAIFHDPSSPNQQKAPLSRADCELLVKPRLVDGTKQDGDEQITCKKILFGVGDEAVYQSAKRIMTADPAIYIDDGKFIELTADCEEFRLRRGYHMTPLNEEESEFPIAYNIIMHRHVVQVRTGDYFVC